MRRLYVDSPVLTPDEAAKWLRLDVDHPDDMGAAVDALYRLVRKGGLRALKIGKRYRFTVRDLERFAYDGGASDEQTEGEGT